MLCVDGTSMADIDPSLALVKLEEELSLSPYFANSHHKKWVVVNKCDAVSDQDLIDVVGYDKVFYVSSLSGKGLDELKASIVAELKDDERI